jgi:hypothetical protein
MTDHRIVSPKEWLEERMHLLAKEKLRLENSTDGTNFLHRAASFHPSSIVIVT